MRKNNLCAILWIITLVAAIQSSARNTNVDKQRSHSVFPFIMYDSDIGFGFGGRGVVKNTFYKNESFDLILFASTLGEQWYVFTFSIPDFEIRQGTRYQLAFDCKLEYDKFLKSNFFGFGNDTEDNDWQFPKELTKLEITLGHAFTEQLIGEMGLFYNFTTVYGYQNINLLMTPAIPGEGENTTSYLTGRIRWDTRDSQIHPKKGLKLGMNFDLARKSLGGDYAFLRYRIEANCYQTLFHPNHILAARLWAQHIDGTPPYYEQSIIGGGGTARGYKKDRFIDHAMLLASLEYRFIIYRRIGGVLFLDTGRVYDDLSEETLKRWKMNYGWGLRYYLQNFVVRFDMGLSSEGTRIFFNFGHVF